MQFEIIDDNPVLTNGEFMAIYSAVHGGWIRGCFFADSDKYQQNDNHVFGTAEHAYMEAVRIYS